MDNVIIDERRIRVDFSQSVSKLGGGGGERKREGLGKGLEKKTRYRDMGAKKDYSLVFDDVKERGRGAEKHARDGRSRSADRRRDRSRTSSTRHRTRSRSRDRRHRRSRSPRRSHR